jgi:drug/metabolite transporter (DMT)-like permease
LELYVPWKQERDEALNSEAGDRRNAWTAELALMGIAVVWGATFVLVQDAVRLIPVLTFLGYRFVPAALLLAPVFWRELLHLPPSGWGAGLLIGFFLTAGYVLQTFGLGRTSASNAGFITGLFVVLTPLFGALIFGQRAGRTAWGAALVSAVGLFLLSGVGGKGSLEGNGKVSLAGDGLVLLCACAFAFHILVTKRALERHPAGPLVVLQLAACGAVTLLAAGVAGQLEVPRSRTVWIALGVTSLIASALGFFVQTYAQQRTTPARTALLLATEPAFAGLFAYLLKGETLSALGWVGAGLIMGAIVVVGGGRRATVAAAGSSADELRRRE